MRRIVLQIFTSSNEMNIMCEHEMSSNADSLLTLH